MGNHYHIMISGTAKPISRFIGYIQAELAKIIKRITNCYPTNLWKTRFKEQTLHTSKDVIKYLIYLYANPARANLVRKVKDYPGVSSYNMLISGSKSYLTKFVPVRYARLIKGELNSTKKYKELCQKSEGYYEFKLSPFIWKKFFPDTKNRSDESLLHEILDGIKAVEEEYKQINKPVIGRKKLINTKITPHTNQKRTILPLLLFALIQNLEKL